MKKAFFVTLAIIAGLVGMETILPPTTAYAAACNSAADADFLAFPTWSRGLPMVDNGKACSIEMKGSSPASIIFIVALNLVDIAVRIVGLLAVGFVLYGGFRYVMSRGSAEEAKKAQDIILKAVIGLVIAIVATVLVSFLVSNLGA